MSQDDPANQPPDSRADGGALERAEGLLVAQGRLLEMAALGRSLSEIFAELTEAVSRLGPAARAGVFLASADRTQIAGFHSTCMGASFGAAVQGTPINDPAAGAGGAAMHQSRAITCIDIAGSEEWPRSWREVCAGHGILACHSTPVCLPDGHTAGVFFLCFAEARAPSEWELRLAEFGAHLVSVVLERDRAGEALREGERRLRELADRQREVVEAEREAELADTRLLQTISAELIHETDIEGLYKKLVHAAMSIMRSDYASMQMFYPERGAAGALCLLASHGFGPREAEFWQWVSGDSHSTCGMALRAAQRTIVPDIECCDFLAGTQDQAIYRESGLRAAQSTPLSSRGGRLVGMISTHWRKPHQPTERDWRLLDLLARQAADLLERKQAMDELRRHAERFECLLHNAPLASGKLGRGDDGAGDGRQESVAARRILVVDDNRDAADTLGMLLTFLGADVRTAHDGPAALAALQAYQPSVILLDIGMPVMDGFELARRIRQRPEGQSVALIALTGWGQEEDRRRSREAGIDHHLVKPVDLNALQTLLASLGGDDSPRRGEPRRADETPLRLTREQHAYDDANPTR